MLSAHFQVGFAINDQGDAMLFAEAGPSVGGGVTTGLSVTAEQGSLNDLVSPTGQGGGASFEVAPGVTRPSVSAVLNDKGRPVGLTIGEKGGLGAFINISNGGVATPTISLRSDAPRTNPAAADCARQQGFGSLCNR